MNLLQLQKEAYRIAYLRGQWSHDPNGVYRALRHLVSEIDELQEAFEEGENLTAIGLELADVVLCAASICERMKLDLTTLLDAKMSVNAHRIMSGKKHAERDSVYDETEE